MVHVVAAPLLAAAATAAQAGTLRLCDTGQPLTATQHDRALRFAATVKSELERSGASVALVARAGTDLARFGMRYSHAGIALRANPAAPWSVRQLYYDCDESRPRLFDQGLTSFVIGAQRPDSGFLSVLLLPAEPAARLERAALDDRLALALLQPQYSANAYPWALTFQNCNQWVVELLAAAWADPAADAAWARPDKRDSLDTATLRRRSQTWLREQAYEPAVFEVGWRVAMLAANLFVPWISEADHPAEDLNARRYRVTMPASIEAFVYARLPQVRRLEFCHDDKQIVVREGASALPDNCTAAPGDRVLPLD